MNKKRIYASVLCALMVTATAASLSSCADSQSAGTTTTATGTSDSGAVNTVNIPDDVRFDGEEISFAIAETDGDGFHKRSIISEDADTTNSVDAAVFERNAWVEERLGVEIVEGFYSTSQNIRSSIVRTSLAAGDSDYDVICGLQWNDVELCLEGTLADLNELYEDGQKIDYLNLDADYWSTYYIDAMRCGNSIYWLTGDLCLRYTGGFYCMFVNQQIYEDTLMSQYGSLYDLVKQGDWTLDLLAEMIPYAFQDDGDDVLTKSDQLGLALPVWDNVNGLSIGAGVVYSTRNDDGSINLTFNNTNTTALSFMSKIYSLLNSGYCINYGGDYSGAMKDFASGKSCFISGRLNQAELYLSEMSDNYYIVPCPKLDSTQTSYHSSVHDGINLYGINASSEHLAATAATLELMAYGSYTNVRSVYYDQALKYMYSRDSGAAEMIDLMGSVVYSDFVYIWQFSDYFSGLGDFLRGNVTANKASSAMKRYQNQWQSGLESVLEDIEALEDI